MELEKARENLEYHFWTDLYIGKVHDDILRLENIVLWYIELGMVVYENTDLEGFINFLDNEQKKHGMFSLKQYAIRDYLHGDGSPSRDMKPLTFDEALLRNKELTLDELRFILNRRYGLFIASKNRSREEKLNLLQEFVSLGGVIDDILDSDDPIDLPGSIAIKELLASGSLSEIKYFSDSNKRKREEASKMGKN